MSTTASTDLLARVRDLNEHIAGGRIIEAMNEFYDPHVEMQENANDPCIGLEANIKREKEFLEQVRDWKGFEVKAVAAAGDVTFVESVIDFINTNDQPVHLEQVSVARWKDGRIVHERFYYDSGASD